MNKPSPIGAQRFGRDSSWKSAYDLTERETEIVVALMTAQRTGYDGATGADLLSVGVSRSIVSQIMSLVRRGLVECAGHTDERAPRKVWRATGKAFRRFQITEARPIPVEIETVEGRAELVAERERDRRRRRAGRAKGAA